jgi:molybdenum cofactor cytidylyltransferase
VAGFAALVLAAGAGTRFGGGKLLSPYGSGVLLDGALAAAFAAPAGRVILVTGFDAEGVAAAARAFAERAGEGGRLILVHAAGHAQGLSASLRAGLAAVPPEAEGAFVFLGDMPRVPPAMAGRLAAAIGPRLAAAPVFEGRRGHPVLLRRALFPRLAALEGDRGAGALLAGLGDEQAQVETDDPGVVFDVDAPGDLAT